MIHTLLEMIQNDFTFRVVSFGSLILGMISGALMFRSSSKTEFDW